MPRAAPLVCLLVPLAYLLGSIPFGLIVGQSQGVDPRNAGSGNIGATNVGRLLGPRFFALVFVLDLLKGLLPMLAAWALLRHQPAGHQTFLLWLLVGLAAILGHMFSAFLKFKGGKGVATSTGVVLGLFPYYTAPGLAAAVIWFAMWKLTRYISIASVVGAIVFPIAYLCVGLWRGWPVTGEQWPLLAFAILIAALIVVKHRGNLARLMSGTEHRFSPPRVPADEPAPPPPNAQGAPERH